jgi:hypothetical protein
VGKTDDFSSDRGKKSRNLNSKVARSHAVKMSEYQFPRLGPTPTTHGLASGYRPSFLEGAELRDRAKTNHGDNEHGESRPGPGP